ncbi:MAG: PilZ domain-containing protein [Treponema sp.]|jgi:hypothetical protein|nr:PilZ domain-containing protein [Treponema sp.]
MSGENAPSEIQGKKTFFLYPTASVENQIVTELVQQEFEVYVAKDHARLLRALKKYTDSIVFINIDEGMAEPEWEKWIRGMMTALPNVTVGIFSGSNKEELQHKYLNDVHVQGGFNSLKVDMSKSIAKVLETLKNTDAKGRRKYIRANTEREANATINLPMNGDFVNGTVKDISVVGISCAFDHDPDLKKNELIKDIQLRLQTMLLKVEAIVFGSRMDNADKIYVLLFSQRIDPEVRTKIRKYIQHSLQHKMDSELK